MLVTLTYLIVCANTQKATATRDGGATWIQDQGCTIINASMAQTQPRFKVHGVDVTTCQPFSLTVEAEDADQARQQVEEPARGKAIRVVALVQRDG